MPACKGFRNEALDKGSPFFKGRPQVNKPRCWFPEHGNVCGPGHEWWRMCTRQVGMFLIFLLSLHCSLQVFVWLCDICGMFSIYTVMDVLPVGLSSQGLFLPIIDTLTYLRTSKPGFTGQTIVATQQFQQDVCGLNETALSGCSFNAKLPYATSNGSWNASDQGELHWLTKHNWVIFRGFHYYHSQWGQFVQKWLGNKCFERQSEALCKYSQI